METVRTKMSCLGGRASVHRAFGWQLSVLMELRRHNSVSSQQCIVRGHASFRDCLQLYMKAANLFESLGKAALLLRQDGAEESAYISYRPLGRHG